MIPGEEHPPAVDAASKKVLFSEWKRVFTSPETVLLLVLAVLGLSLTWWDSVANDVGVDFYQFWVVGQSLNHPGIDNIYSQDARERLGADFFQKAARIGNSKQLSAAKYRQVLETYSSPLLYVFFGMFSSGDYETDYRNYRLLMLICLCAGIGIFCRLLGHSWGLTFGAIAIFSNWFEPFSSDVRVGNVNSLQFAALAVYLWIITRMKWRYRDLLGGVFLGFIVVFKPNLVFVPGMLGVYWAMNRAIRRLMYHAMGGVLGFLAAFLIGTLGFGNIHCWIDWLSALHSLPDKIITVDLGNFSPARIFNKWIGINIEIPLMIFFGVAALATIWFRRAATASPQNEIIPTSDGFSEVLVVSIGCLLVVLVPRLAWMHYYLLTIPAFLVLLKPIGNISPGWFVMRQFLLVIAFLSFATAPMLCLGIPFTTRIQGLLIVCATLMLFIGLAFFPRQTSPAGTGGTQG